MIRLRTIRPTRRGIGTVVVVAIALGVGVESRSIGAIVIPGSIAIVAGAIQLARTEPPTLTRPTPEPGFPGEQRAIAVTVDSTLPCSVVESVGDGVATLDGDKAVTEVIGHGGEFEYTVNLDRRGRHQLGPARCRVTDSLGLFRAAVVTDDATTVLVYPRVHELKPGALSQFGGHGRGRAQGWSDERAAFDRLRQFTPDDTMRDIHWRASAKRPADEFLVSEYTGQGARGAITVVGEAATDGVDAMASAVGSIVLHLLEAGVTLTVVVPSGKRLVRPSEAAEALRLLAITESGTRSEADQVADIHVRGDEGAATVRVAGSELEFDAIADGSRERAVIG
jgi:uncharacterized protein (DUF58 family)